MQLNRYGAQMTRKAHENHIRPITWLKLTHMCDPSCSYQVWQTNDDLCAMATMCVPQACFKLPRFHNIRSVRNSSNRRALTLPQAGFGMRNTQTCSTAGHIINQGPGVSTYLPSSSEPGNASCSSYSDPISIGSSASSNVSSYPGGGGGVGGASR